LPFFSFRFIEPITAGSNSGIEGLSPVAIIDESPSAQNNIGAGEAQIEDPVPVLAAAKLW
jgi:hypothetical protein